MKTAPPKKLSARFCPLCGTQHAVEKGKPSPWTPLITRQQIEALPQLVQLLGDVEAWLTRQLIRGNINCGTGNRDGDLVSQIRAAIAQAKGEA